MGVGKGGEESLPKALPLGKKETELISLSWAVNVITHFPWRISQIFAVVSDEPWKGWGKIKKKVLVLKIKIVVIVMIIESVVIIRVQGLCLDFIELMK